MKITIPPQLGSHHSFIRSYMIEPSICDSIVSEFERLDSTTNLTYPGAVAMNKEGSNNFGINKNIKDSLDLQLEYINEDIQNQYVNSLSNCLQDYLKVYEFANNVAPFCLKEQNNNIQKYLPGGGFKAWHMENSGGTVKEAARHLVYMTYLNDLEGGGTEFYYQDIKTEAKKGLTLIWPAGWTHTHRGVISEKETKYIVTGWFYFDEIFG